MHQIHPTVEKISTDSRWEPKIGLIITSVLFLYVVVLNYDLKGVVTKHRHVRVKLTFNILDMKCKLFILKHGSELTRGLLSCVQTNCSVRPPKSKVY